ncbi:MAG TPA: hypothetical protein VJ953_01605 [Saprospiraceae bacterium]|nr:hypothetical protein [Saprospiraceae bacterium]
MENAKAFKEKVFRHAVDQVEERIEELEKQLDRLMESKESETKSSMGDKYETGATMIQIDEEKVREQLNRNRSVKVDLEQLILDKVYPQVNKGNLVETDKGIYFVGIGLGQIKIDGQPCFCVSTEAPVGQALLGSKVGDEINYNESKIKIEAIH